tara:strand:+ start:3263 stop:3670 length:408 start_codon:yes stop_codon:yes gene_type:complete
MENLILFNFFISSFMLGLILTTQIVSYPMFLKVENSFSDYHMSYVNKISTIAAPFMILELLLSLLVVFLLESYIAVIIFLIMLLIFLCTFFIQVPIHETLKNNFNVLLCNKLIKTNWIRVFLWLLKCIASFMLIN